MFKIEKLEKYIEIEKEDFIIEDDKILEKLRSLPTLHSKWLKFFYREQMLFFKYDEIAKKVWRTKHEYYLSQYSFEIKHNQVHWYIESDDEYIKISRKANVQKKIVMYLEEVVKKVNNLNWILKNMIEWKKFTLGI